MIHKAKVNKNEMSLEYRKLSIRKRVSSCIATRSRLQMQYHVKCQKDCAAIINIMYSLSYDLPSHYENAQDNQQQHDD
jgi:hypothetical protein